MEDLGRRFVEKAYTIIYRFVFHLTDQDPEKAHDWFIQLSKYLNLLELDKLLLDNPSNRLPLPIEISTAAGFDKNGEIPPLFLKYLGFDRVVVGTFTYESYEGNERPRMKRLRNESSLLNWAGLPNDGCLKVIENLDKYKNQYEKVPLTLSVSITPEKKGEEVFEEIINLMLSSSPYGDRYEINISCPNVGNLSGFSAEQLWFWDSVLELFDNHSNKEQYLKVSPALNFKEVRDILSLISEHNINGVVCTNTLPFVYEHRDNVYRGGVSGRLLKEASLKVQEYFAEEIEKRNLDLKIIACGGIENVEDVKKRIELKASGIQIYTPLIFYGPKLVREFRNFLLKYSSYKEY